VFYLFVIYFLALFVFLPRFARKLPARAVRVFGNKGGAAVAPRNPPRLCGGYCSRRPPLASYYLANPSAFCVRLLGGGGYRLSQYSPAFLGIFSFKKKKMPRSRQGYIAHTIATPPRLSRYFFL